MPSSSCKQRYIYADNAATTPLSAAARTAMEPFFTDIYANPSGIHRLAKRAADKLSQLREQLAACIQARPRELYITSGGSESNNWILRSAAEQVWQQHGRTAQPVIITSAIEHHSVLHCCTALEQQGVVVEYLPVDQQGFISVTDLDNALKHHKHHVALVSLMLANNEVGSIEPIAELAACAHAHGVRIHTDAVQALGHIPVDVTQLGVDALSFSAHKFHGPCGIGGLYVRSDMPMLPLIAGGAQEYGMRAGTENLAGMAGMTAALVEVCKELGVRSNHVSVARDALIQAVLNADEQTQLSGPRPGAHRLPSLASFICTDVDAELLVVMLDQAGIAAATGSACASGSTEPSHVICALGYTDARQNRGSLRLSLSDDISDEDTAYLCEHVPAVIKRCRLLSGSTL
ncbi:cysteine desulfurase [Collinsella sp. zg1085]|nr:cysteine desulfurase [Collinsella sp. zg1085]